MSKADWLYGMHAVLAVLESAPERVLELKIQSSRQDEKILRLQDLSAQFGVAVGAATKQQLDDLTQGGNHQGVAARCRLAQPQTEHELMALVQQKKQGLFLLILDSVTDPHNLGACLRCADAAGVDAVVTTKDKASGLTPVVRKVAVGAAEVVPFIQVTNLARTLKQLQDEGVWIVGAALDETAVSLYDADLKGNLAIVMGAEGSGLRRLTKEACDSLVYIPMCGRVDSLNVSVAAGVCLFEANRQRVSTC